MPGLNSASGRSSSGESWVRAERVSPVRLELRLLPEADIGAVINLAQLEAACCAFFSFTIEIEADRLVLAVEVPSDAVEALDQLVSDTALSLSGRAEAWRSE